MSSGFKVSLLPDDQELYDKQLTQAKPLQLQLARQLQIAAGTAPLATDFKPAPIYMRQAMAITLSLHNASMIADLIYRAMKDDQ